MQKDRETERQIDRQTDRQTDRSIQMSKEISLVSSRPDCRVISFKKAKREENEKLEAEEI